MVGRFGRAQVILLLGTAAEGDGGRVVCGDGFRGRGATGRGEHETDFFYSNSTEELHVRLNESSRIPRARYIEDSGFLGDDIVWTYLSLPPSLRISCM